MSAHKFMHRLQIIAVECRYKDVGKHLKQKFSNGLNDDNILVVIIHSLTPLTDMTTVTSKQE